MDNVGMPPGKVEAFEAMKIRVQRSNMLGVCRMCVKSIVDKSAFESINDDCPHLNNFCNVMEHIFSHRLQARWSLFSSGDQVEFWEVITHFAHRTSIGSVLDMEEINSDLGRGRAWIRLSLVQKRLASFMHHLLSKHDDLKKYYQPGGFLISEELTELAGTLRCLDAIDLNLCLKDQDFDFGDKKEIHYEPYLRFRQSHSSRIDDSIEAHKLLNQHDETADLRELVGGSEEEEEGEGDEAFTIKQLKETIKTERDQKNYFEELVSVRDSQVTRLQTEINNVTTESEVQRKGLESIVLELQKDIEKLQHDLRESQNHHLQSNGREQTFNHSESTVTSPKKRATSFLANLLGD